MPKAAWQPNLQSYLRRWRLRCKAMVSGHFAYFGNSPPTVRAPVLDPTCEGEAEWLNYSITNELCR